MNYLLLLSFAFSFSTFANRMSSTCYNALRGVLESESKFQYSGRKFIFSDESGKIVMTKNPTGHFTFFRAENNERIVEPEQYQVRKRAINQISKELFKIANLENYSKSKNHEAPTVSTIRYYEEKINKNLSQAKKIKNFEEKRVINEDNLKALWKIKSKITIIKDRLRECEKIDNYELIAPSHQKFYNELKIDVEKLNSRITKKLRKKQRRSKYCRLGEVVKNALSHKLSKDCHLITKSEVEAIDYLDISHNHQCEMNKTIKVTDFKDFKNLTRLTISRCEVRELGPLAENLQKLKKLKHLNLTNNQMTNLEYKDLKRLKLDVLKIYGNPINYESFDINTIKYISALAFYDGKLPEYLNRLEAEVLGVKKTSNNHFKTQVLTNYCMSLSRGSDYIGQCLLDEIELSKKQEFNDFRDYCHYYEEFANKSTYQCYLSTMKAFYQHPEMDYIHKSFFSKCISKSTSCYNTQSKEFLNALK